MPLVVSDTSPIRALAQVGLLELLPRLFGDIIIPPAVARELAFPPAGAISISVVNLTFLQVRSPLDLAQLDKLRSELDSGEAEAIALASELRALLLIDEAEGRAAAIALGIHVTGVIGVLLIAKRSLLVPSIRPLLDQLRQDGRFFLSERIYSQALRLANE